MCIIYVYVQYERVYNVYVPSLCTVDLARQLGQGLDPVPFTSGPRVKKSECKYDLEGVCS